MLIKDFEQKIKKREKIKDKLNLPKKKTLILGNIFNDNVDLNTIDNIVKTDPNQVIHIKKKIKNQNNKKEHQFRIICTISTFTWGFPGFTVCACTSRI